MEGKKLVHIRVNGPKPECEEIAKQIHEEMELRGYEVVEHTKPYASRDDPETYRIFIGVR